jgi:hypothetical protein
MRRFQLYDAVSLVAEVPLEEGGVAPVSTAGAIVEVFNNGEAYLVELFGGWVKAEVNGNFTPASEDEPEAFMETIGVETLYPHQMKLVKSAQEIMGIRDYVNTILETLPDELVAEVRDFAEFLQQKQQQNQASVG